MKHIPNIVGGLLGLAFVASAIAYFSGASGPPPDPGSPTEHFMAAFIPTGYMNFVKVCEILGGLLCMVPLTRNIGLLFLGPIILNIAAFHLFVEKKDVPMAAVFCVISAYLLWTARAKFTALLNR
ncbi:MAG: hypothetical protein EOP88_11505 [Verrucomicrobiaceae bacterium]|nr:MAG: hypothetical protein EOP88_11505 [Verrucomicrobiaceae bacterium]